MSIYLSAHPGLMICAPRSLPSRKDGTMTRSIVSASSSRGISVGNRNWRGRFGCREFDRLLMCGADLSEASNASSIIEPLKFSQ